MTLPQDSFMLLSVINTYLRDRYATLAALCEGEDIDQKTLVDRLGRLEFIYNPDVNQFR